MLSCISKSLKLCENSQELVLKSSVFRPFEIPVAYRLRARAKITSQSFRSDLGWIWSIWLSEAAGIVSYFEDFVNEDWPKRAWSRDVPLQRDEFIFARALRRLGPYKWIYVQNGHKYPIFFHGDSESRKGEKNIYQVSNRDEIFVWRFSAFAWNSISDWPLVDP